jgi:hypothetical protein
MKAYPNATAFAADVGISLADIEATFTAHEAYAAGTQTDPFGKGAFGLRAYLVMLTPSFADRFHNALYPLDSPLHVAIITPVVHYVRGRLFSSSSC